MAFYQIFQKEKEIVYTASVDIGKKLEDAGFKLILYIEGKMEGSGTGVCLQRGQDWVKAQKGLVNGKV